MYSACQNINKTFTQLLEIKIAGFLIQGAVTHLSSLLSFSEIGLKISKIDNFLVILPCQNFAT